VQSKRAGAVVSALRALYVAEDGTKVSLASLVWIPNASSALADLKRLNFVARRDLRLEELLEVFGRGQAREVNQRYRGGIRQHALRCPSRSIGAYRPPALRFNGMSDGIGVVQRAERQTEQTVERLGND
jgi:hypothetical protein